MKVKNETAYFNSFGPGSWRLKALCVFPASPQELILEKYIVRGTMD
jgi:hypothetical protein